MRYYAQFYSLVQNANGDWSYQEGCGDRQIIRIDGRHNIHVMHDIAADECRVRKYDGYRIGRGERLDDLFWLTAAVKPLPREVKA